jgi:hypothetical protein
MVMSAPPRAERQDELHRPLWIGLRRGATAGLNEGNKRCSNDEHNSQHQDVLQHRLL